MCEDREEFIQDTFDGFMKRLRLATGINSTISKYENYRRLCSIPQPPKLAYLAISFRIDTNSYLLVKRSESSALLLPRTVFSIFSCTDSF